MITLDSYYHAIRDTVASLAKKCPGKQYLDRAVQTIVTPIFNACSAFISRGVELGKRVVKWFCPDPLKIGYIDDQEYKPRILVTGEKTDYRVMQALKKYTQQEHVWVPLEELRAKSHSNTLGYDKNKDLLLLLIHKCPGNTPIRGFAALDGPLNPFKTAICDFTRRASLVLVHENENHAVEQIQRQADLQLPEAKAKALNALKGWNIVKAVQTLFSTTSGSFALL